MLKILLIISVILNVILIVKVVLQRRELNDCYSEYDEEDEFEDENTNYGNNVEGSSKSKIDYMYKFLKNERDGLFEKIKNNNLKYQNEFSRLSKELERALGEVKKLEEEKEELLKENTSLKQNIQNMEELQSKVQEEEKALEKEDKKDKKQTKTRRKKVTPKEEIKRSDEDELLDVLFEKDENKKVDSKLANMQKGELLNYFTNLFNTLKNGNPSDLEVQETYTNAIKDIKEYEEAKSIVTGLLTEDGKLKMRTLMNYIDQLQM